MLLAIGCWLLAAWLLLGSYTGSGVHVPRIARVSKIKIKRSSPDFWPNPGPGRLHVDSGRGNNFEFARVSVFEASLAVNIVPEFMLEPGRSKKLRSNCKRDRVLSHGHHIFLEVLRPALGGA